MKVKIKQLPNGLSIPFPKKATEGAAGFDICAANYYPIRIKSQTSKLIPTGFALEVPYGYEVQIRSRSGLALNKGVIVLNSPGTIDSDYRGEVSVILRNESDIQFTVNRGDKIAQMVLKKIEDFEFIKVGELQDTERGGEGFGSTGV